MDAVEITKTAEHVSRSRMSDAQRVVSEEKRRNWNIALGKSRRAAANSIGKIPKCKNPRRRELAEKTIQAWIETYLLSLFTNPKGEHYPWSKSQIEAMEVVDHVLIHGGNFAIAMRRGGFKTGVCKAAALKGAFTGVHQWAAVIAATKPKSEKIIESFKTVIELSPLLFEDYPEICVPIRALEGETARTKRQTYLDGREQRRTRVRWSPDRIVFPDIVGAAGRQAVLSSTGLTGSEIRGLLMTTGDLVDRRPTLLLIDDVETDESAGSDIQAPERLNLVHTAMEMGGPGAPISCFYAGTIIAGDSVCARVISSPMWHALLKPALPVMPLHCAETPPEIEHHDLWGQHAELLHLKDPIEARERANDHYLRHRAKAECLPILDQPRPCPSCEMRDRCMDANAIVDWVHGKDPDQLSAVQFCMEKYILKPEVFFAEFQQAPRTLRESGARVLPLQIMQKVNGFARRQVPGDATYLTCGIDVQKHFLFYSIAAWSNDFTGEIIDYGTWPDQKRRHFRRINPPHPLRLDYPGLDDEAMLFAGIQGLLLMLKSLEFPVAGGGRMKQIDKVLIDSRYGTPLVYRAIRKAQWGNVAIPCKGIGISPGRKPISLWENKPGYRIGDNWFFPPVKGTQESPHVSINVAPWKSRLHRALSLGMGTRGGLSLFGTMAESYQHELYANHIGASERPLAPVYDSFGNEIIRWETIPGGADNEGLDSAVYMMVAASILGIKSPTESQNAAAKMPRVIRPSGERRARPTQGDSIYS